MQAKNLKTKQNQKDEKGNKAVNLSGCID